MPPIPSLTSASFASEAGGAQLWIDGSGRMTLARLKSAPPHQLQQKQLPSPRNGGITRMVRDLGRESRMLGAAASTKGICFRSCRAKGERAGLRPLRPCRPPPSPPSPFASLFASLWTTEPGRVVDKCAFAPAVAQPVGEPVSELEELTLIIKGWERGARSAASRPDPPGEAAMVSICRFVLVPSASASAPARIAMESWGRALALALPRSDGF